MEGASSVIAISMGVGGAVFTAFILFWFVRAYFKRQAESGQARDLAQALHQRTAWEEKRAQPRLSVSWPAEISSAHGQENAVVQDISLGGAFVACRPLALSDRLRIRIELPGGEPLALAAEVVWSNANVPPERVVHRGMGIRFIQLDPVGRTRLAKAVNALAAASGA
jgi:PilZ domain